ncbi:MAG: amidohydrolase [Canibacter sp.]
MNTIIRAHAMLAPQGIMHDAEIEIETDRIVYAGARRDTFTGGDAVEVVELPNSILMPGLTNGHTHSAMTLLRAVNDDHGFMPWLEAVQAIEQQLTHEDVAAGLELAMLEMISSGTVSFADMYVWDERLIELVRQAGMRVNAALASNDPNGKMFPGVSNRSGREELDYADELFAQYHNDPQVRISYGPHAPYSVPEDFMREIIERSHSTGVPVQIHIAESPAEVAQLRETTGHTPADYLAGLGLFETNVLAAHCVHLTAAEMQYFAGVTHTAASHNPVSNLKLGNGVAPMPDWIAHDFRIAIGTDSVASNNSLDLFEEVKLATILHRGVRHDAAAITAQSVLEIATRRGAEAIGFADSGALEAGMLADVIALDLGEAIPRDNLVSHLAFAANGRDVSHVWIGGRAIYEDRKFLTLDAADIRQRAADSIARLRHRDDN